MTQISREAHRTKMYHRRLRQLRRAATVGTGLPPTKYHPWPRYPHAQTRERARRLGETEKI